MTAISIHRTATGPPRWVNRLVLSLLRSPAHGLLDRHVCELHYRGPQTGRAVSLPVAYALDRGRIVVLAGDAAGKRWWRAFRKPWPVTVHIGRQVHDGVGQVLAPADRGYADALFAYRQSRRPMAVGADDRLLVIA